MKIMTSLAIATGAAILGGGFTSASAQNSKDAADGAKPGRHQLWQRIAKKLDLTDDQKSQLQAVWSGEKGAVTSLFSQLHETRKNLRAAILSNANEQVAALLTPEQAVRFE